MLLSQKTLFTSLTLAILFLGAAATAWADAVTVYSTRTDYNNASTNNQTIDFEGYAPADGLTAYPNGLTILGVRFEAMTTRRDESLATHSDLIAQGPSRRSDIPFNSDWNSGVTLVGGLNENHPGQRYSGGLTITLPEDGATAFGLDLGRYGAAGSYRITLSTGEIFFVDTATYPTFEFFGFTSVSPVAWIQFRAIDERFGNSTSTLLDNVTFGRAAPVPEPATLFLLGTGLAGLAARRRRRHQAHK